MRFTKDEKAFLDAVIENPPDLQGRWYTRDYVRSLVADKINAAAFNAIIHGLEISKAIFWGDKQRTAFELTSLGLEYKERDKMETRDKWRERCYGFFSAILIEVLAFIAIKIFLKQ